ncbi:hypothetical protein ACGFSB_04315 [Streptomyces sp. NPDC048441]|uniref:hypothetical protein n=1 Tax=Streptomyces sp. NPDC048441 TaxID=3365552 RepID=UPI00371E535D
MLPDVYRDIIEVLTDAAKPMQAKQIVPRIGLPAVTGKIRDGGVGRGTTSHGLGVISEQCLLWASW